MLQLCRLWQRQHKTKLDGVLICGDLGFFPDLSRLDKATKRFAKRDPEELGFAYYFAWPEPAERDRLVRKILGRSGKPEDRVGCDILWCKGNHEDFDLLDEVTRGADVATVDAYDALTFVRCGNVVELAGLQIASVGGAPEPFNESGAKGDSRKWVDGKACNQLVGESFDVLLSHGSPRNIGGESDAWGSQLLRDLVELNQPAYHFYAHHTSAIAPATIANTKCFWMNDVAFQGARRGKFGQVEPGCMGILSWRGENDHEFNLVSDDWFLGVTGDNWLHL